jgi:hypothetical protein
VTHDDDDGDDDVFLFALGNLQKSLQEYNDSDRLPESEDIYSLAKMTKHVK